MKHLNFILYNLILILSLLSFNNCSDGSFDSKLITSLGHDLSNGDKSDEFISKNSKIKQGDHIVIKGSGFGTKDQAQPVLIDYVDHAFENGKLNSTHSTLGDLESIPLGVNDDEGAVWSTKTKTFYYTTSRAKRTPYSKASYYLEGNNAWVGGVVAYGGPSGWDTPVDNPQLYISWWYKNKYNSTFYWRFSPNEQVGEFIQGEDLLVSIDDESKQKGVYIGIDEEGLHNAVLYGHVNSNKLKDKKITGSTSKASTVFPDVPRYGKGYGFQSPGSKLARIWDDPKGADGIRSSIAIHNFYVSSARVYDSLKLPSNEWVHLEYELDTEKGVIRMYEDGRFRGEDFFSPDAIYKGKYSPTLSLLGTNAHQLKLQESDISEVYVDNSLQRIIVGPEENFEKLTHYEVQMPINWSDKEVEFKLNLGSLSTNSQLYGFVIDRNGKPINTKGVPLCENNSCSK